MKQLMGKWKNYKAYLIVALESFLTTWAFMMASKREMGDILSLVFFCVSFIGYQRCYTYFEKNPQKKVREAVAVSGILSVLFTLFYMLVTYEAYLEQIAYEMLYVPILAVVSVGFVILFYHLLLFLFTFMNDKDRLQGFLCGEKTFKPGFYQQYIGLCTFLICMIAWLPFFLYQYPAIMSPDSINQFQQAIGVAEYSNHHPAIHTLVIQLCYNMGMLITGNQIIAISFYTILQMCFMAGAVAYLVKTMKLLGVRDGVCLMMTLFYALVSYHGMYVITIWKDIPFAGIVLLFSCCLLRLRRKVDIKNIILLGILSVMMCLFRSNGWYGFLVTLPVLLFYFRKQATKFFPVLFGALAIVIVVKYPVMNSLQIEQPDFVESLSIPVQQVARVLINERELTVEEQELIDKVITSSAIEEVYDPNISDGMKWLVRFGNQEYLENHKLEYFKLWITLGIKYPGDYLKAYVDQTYGFYSPSSSENVIISQGILSTAHEYGLHSSPILGGGIVQKIFSLLLKLGELVPLYGLLWNMAVVFWIFLICMACTFVRKEKAKLVYYIPSLALYLTVLIATPVAHEFRYVYFMIYTLPFYIIVAMTKLPEN